MHRDLPYISAETPRFTLLFRIACFFSLLLSCGWLGYFIWLHEWELVASLIIFGIMIIPSFPMFSRGLAGQGIIWIQLVSLVYIIIFCYRYDVSNLDFQRTTHLYIPIIAFIGYINYKQTKSRFQLFLISLSVIFFILLSSNVSFLSLTQSKARSFQAFGVWINPVMATLLFAWVVVATHSDFSSKAKRIKKIQNALYNDQFFLLYQPIVNQKGKVTGAEALIRWHHPTLGIIAPNGFIPDAQEAGLMPMIGEWVIAQAFTDLRNWQSNPATCGLTVSINITADHFMQPDFSRKLLDKIHTKSIPCQQVHLELTESIFVSEPDVVAAKMDELAAIGLRFSLDDFGTGFSSLSTLRRLPLNQIKIDRSFVASAHINSKGAVIAKNIARLGNELGLEVVAEGIETPQQWAIMKSYGCRVFQGFLFSRPVSNAEFIKYTTASLTH